MTRVPIPDDIDGEAKKGKKRALESEEEPEKKKKKSDTTSTSQPPRSDPPPPTESPSSKSSKAIPSAISAGSSKGIRKKPAPESSIKTSTKEPIGVEQKLTRAAAVDLFDSDGLGSHPSSKPSASQKSIPPKPVKSKLSLGSKDPAPTKSKLLDEKPSGAKTILKSSKKVTGRITPDVPAKVKHVKFEAKLSDSKTKRDKALGLTDKKVRSGGGKSASAKDRVLGKKVAVK